MFKRKAYDRLTDWKTRSDGKSAILIEGARRVGKSTIAEEFARNKYASYVLVDFTRVSGEFKQRFLDTRTNLDSFFLYLSATFGVSLRQRDSLVIFDEVQLFPQAREFIKHLVKDGRYDYLETGSLVSIKKNVRDILIPSEEESLQMNAMDFEEFLWAMDEVALADMIRSAFDEGVALPDSIHRKANLLWREYLLVGGMPQAVAAYKPGRDMAAADHAKRLILKLYRDDIEKYGGGASKRIKAVFDAIPSQLAKHEKKLVYTQIENGSRSRDFMTAFSWMKETRTVTLCTLVEDPSVGLALSEDDKTVKCYLADTGLLSCMAFSSVGDMMPEVYRQVLTGKVSVNEGMLVENAVLQQLVARGHAPHFYSKASPIREDRMEIDFIIVCPYPNAAMKPRVSPIEVKSGNRYLLTSLDKFKAKFGKRVGTEYVLHNKQYKTEGDRVFLPLYMAHCL